VVPGSAEEARVSGSGDEVLPCIKGLVLQPAVRRLEHQIELGKIGEPDLDAQLDAEDRWILEQRVAPTLWYPITSYERIVELVRAAEGGVGDAYWVRFGRENGEDVLESKAVSVFLRSARGFGPRAGIALIKLSQIFFNFAEWSFEGKTLESFTIDVRKATAMPDSVRLGTLGFIIHLVCKFVGDEIDIVSERPSRDHVIFRTR